MRELTEPSNTSFARHVFAVQRYVFLTAPRYAPLFKPDLVVHPICCFGDPAKARIVTVGLNPSDGEFTLARKWPDESMDHKKLADRCRTYFAAPHDWFEPWEKGLQVLNASYQDGSGVHLDLSPRPTRPVSKLKEHWEQDLFINMVERDLWAFFGTLDLCAKAQLVMMAGTVTGKYYMNEFLQRFAPDYGYSLDGAFNRSEYPGRGKIAWHVLSGSRRRIKVFFCSSSPSDMNVGLLHQRIMEHADNLKL